MSSLPSYLSLFLLFNGGAGNRIPATLSQKRSTAFYPVAIPHRSAQLVPPLYASQTHCDAVCGHNLGTIGHRLSGSVPCSGARSPSWLPGCHTRQCEHAVTGAWAPGRASCVPPGGAKRMAPERCDRPRLV